MILDIQAPAFFAKTTTAGHVSGQLDSVPIDVSEECIIDQCAAADIEGVYFLNASDQMDALIKRGATRAHLFADESDVLVDAYLDLEDKAAGAGEYVHYATLRGGLIALCAKVSNTAEVSVQVGIPNRSDEAVVTMGAQEYLSEWRRFVNSLAQAVA